jgi:hypothetical protein
MSGPGASGFRSGLGENSSRLAVQARERSSHQQGRIVGSPSERPRRPASRPPVAGGQQHLRAQADHLTVVAEPAAAREWLGAGMTERRRWHARGVTAGPARRASDRTGGTCAAVREGQALGRGASATGLNADLAAGARLGSAAGGRPHATAELIGADPVVALVAGAPGENRGALLVDATVTGTGARRCRCRMGGTVLGFTATHRTGHEGSLRVDRPRAAGIGAAGVGDHRPGVRARWRVHHLASIRAGGAAFASARVIARGACSGRQHGHDDRHVHPTPRHWTPRRGKERSDSGGAISWPILEARHREP